MFTFETVDKLRLIELVKYRHCRSIIELKLTQPNDVNNNINVLINLFEEVTKIPRDKFRRLVISKNFELKLKSIRELESDNNGPSEDQIKMYLGLCDEWFCSVVESTVA